MFSPVLSETIIIKNGSQTEGSAQFTFTTRVNNSSKMVDHTDYPLVFVLLLQIVFLSLQALFFLNSPLHALFIVTFFILSFPLTLSQFGFEKHYFFVAPAGNRLFGL